MACLKGLFGIVNDGSGNGEGLTKVIPGTTLGTAVTTTGAMPAFVNDSGVLVFPQLDSGGNIPVTLDGSGVCDHESGTLVGSTSNQDVVTITGALSKIYNKIGVSIASSTEACWELVHIDDVGVTDTETVLGYFTTGPGQYSYCCELSCVMVDTAAGTGVQEFVLRGLLGEATGSDIKGTVWLTEVTP